MLSPRLLPSLAVLALLGAPATARARAPEGDAPPRASRPVPSLRKAVTVDADLKDLRRGAGVADKALPAWDAKVGYRKDTLYLGVTVTDDRVLNGDVLEVSLQFPGAGTTARGYTWRFGPYGVRGADPELLPEHAHKLAESKVEVGEAGLALELAIPARALPRFPSNDPMVFELCLRYEDRDEQADAPEVTSNCQSGTMSGKALRLPDGFRRALRLRPPESVVGLEGRAEGWVGYAYLHYPTWVSSDGPLTAQVLRRLVAEEEFDAKKAGINLPDALTLPDGSTVLSVLSGEDPYAVEGKCNADRELRVAFYVVRKRTGERVLEWPASTCALGRAAAIQMEEGELTLGYTNGAQVSFVWSDGKFERTEIGSR